MELLSISHQQENTYRAVFLDIAAFNALKASGNPQDIDSVYNWFNKTLFAGARWGTNIFQMVAFLIKHKAFKGFKLTKKGYSDLNVGILLYNVGG